MMAVKTCVECGCGEDDCDESGPWRELVFCAAIGDVSYLCPTCQ